MPSAKLRFGRNWGPRGGSSPVRLGRYRFLEIAGRHRWIFVGFTLTLSAAALAYSLALAPVYSASAVIGFRVSELDQEAVRLLRLQPQPVSSAYIVPDSIIAAEPGASSAIAERTARALPDGDAAAVRNAVSLGPVSSVITEPAPAGTTATLRVTARHPKRTLVARLANTFAEQYIEFRRQAVALQANQALAASRTRLGAIGSSPLERIPAGSLRRRTEEIPVLASLEGRNLTVIERARQPEDARSPHPLRNTLVAAILGLWLASAITVAREYRPT